MKKFITMLLVCVMVLGLFAGCGNGSTQQTTAQPNVTVKVEVRPRCRRNGSPRAGDRGRP